MGKRKTYPLDVQLRFLIDVPFGKGSIDDVAGAIARQLRGNIKEGIRDAITIMAVPSKPVLKRFAEKAQRAAERDSAVVDQTS
jgi:hypothetical protein